jgi:DNA-binding beta-propeller fold protein YncE
MNVKTIAAAAALLAFSAAASAQYRVTSDQTVGGFVNPESVGCDVRGKALYVGNFGSPKLDPTLKDGMGYISKLDLHGKVLEKNFLPVAGGEKLNKPKGIWIQGGSLWVTDIDVIWQFDLKTRKGRKLAIPGIQFANDPAISDGVLYVSDNRSDQVFRIEPANFLNAKTDPKISSMAMGKGVNPNGLWPQPDGTILMVGFIAPDKPRAVYELGLSGQVKAISAPIGRLDGVYRMGDGTLLLTDWNTGSLFSLNPVTGDTRKLAEGFKGPADFCVLPNAGGLTVVVPDLVQSQLRFVQLRK